MTYDDAHIRNIGVLAHVDAGKTTLTEQMLYVSGKIRAPGSVDDGTTQTDWLPVERERGISVRCAQTSFIYHDCQINLIDTPGHVDFAGEVERGLPVLDGAVLLISSVEGIQSHTENLWEALKRLSIPTIIFVNKLDRAGSDAAGVLDSLSEVFGKGFVPLESVSGEETRGAAVRWRDDLHSVLCELAAENDDDIADRFLSDEPISEEELTPHLQELVSARRLFPVCFGSAQNGVGVIELLDTVCHFLPPARRSTVEELSAVVFRIEHDKTMGKIAHVRMYGGELHARDAVTVVHSDRAIQEEEEPLPEKIVQIRKCSGSHYSDVGEVHTGDVAAIYGLTRARVGDTIGTHHTAADFHLANPYLRVRAIPRKPEDLMPLVRALRELSEEDPLIDCQWEKTEREILVNITGEIQLEILSALLSERYGLSADFSAPSVIYKETPSRSGDGFDAYTMPKPCWAIVRLHFDPLPRGTGVEYDPGHVPSNTCFYKYQSHIRQSFFRSLSQGMYGWEVTDFRATLAYAEHHTIHTHPLDFFVCTPMAVMNGFANTGTILLEPFRRCRITVGAEYLGRILSEITQMRGEFDTPVQKLDSVTVECSLPAATSLDYPVRLASRTGGRAVFSSRFEGYRDIDPALGKTSPRRGINPLDRAKYILEARGAIQKTD